MGNAASAYLSLNTRWLAELACDQLFSRRPELERRYGQGGRSRCVEDTRFHLLFLSDALTVDQPTLFLDYVCWTVRLLIARNIPREDLKENFEAIRDVLEREMPDSLGEKAIMILSAGLDEIDGVEAGIPSFLDGDFPQAGLAREYFSACLGRQRQEAVDLVIDAATRSVPLLDLQLNVIQRSQRELGRLWQLNQISVAQEHYCSAVSQLALSQLYPFVRTAHRAHRRPGKIVAACVGDELHEIGVRMVSDSLEAQGWDLIYLGANQPLQGVVTTITESGAKVLALSVTMSFNLRKLSHLVRQVRSQVQGVRILVGGYPFRLVDDLWRNLGADAFAADAGEAVQAVNRLMIN